MRDFIDTASNHPKTACEITLLTRSGPCTWRDTLTPLQLLAQHCAFTGKELRLDKGKPEIIVGGALYSLSDFGTLMIKLFLNVACLCFRRVNQVFVTFPYFAKRLLDSYS